MSLVSLVGSETGSARIDASECSTLESRLRCERDLARECLRAKTELIQMLGHDVRSPLATIRNAATMLACDESPDGKQCRLSMINRAIDNVLAIVDQVLAVEKFDACQMRIEVGRMDLRAVLATAVEQYAPLAQEKGVALILRIDEAVPATILADAVKIGQIMSNLISNAVRFTSVGAVIVTARTRVATEPTVLELSVVDSGIGIAADRVTAVFDPFSQGRTDIERDCGGYGLGLAICRRLVALHGGSMQVQSTPGIGSRFWFTIDITPLRALKD